MRPKPLQHLPEEKKTSWLRNILVIACLLLTSSSLFSQTKTVTGTVTDALNEPPDRGISIDTRYHLRNSH